MTSKALKPPTPSQARKAVERFNKVFPVGTYVRYWKGVREGRGKIAKTRSEAQLRGDRTAVVFLEGVSGCVVLTRVEPIGELLARAELVALEFMAWSTTNEMAGSVGLIETLGDLCHYLQIGKSDA